MFLIRHGTSSSATVCTFFVAADIVLSQVPMDEPSETDQRVLSAAASTALGMADRDVERCYFPGSFLSCDGFHAHVRAKIGLFFSIFSEGPDFATVMADIRGGGGIWEVGDRP